VRGGTTEKSSGSQCRKSRKFLRKDKSMTEILQQYEKLVHSFSGDPNVVAGQMFGKACLKVGGKAFLAQHKEAIVFKLTGASHAKAMSQDGAALWDPSGKGRPMKEWVALQSSSSRLFKSLAASAYEYVSNAG
jgi:hypothetical protein